tara:strand:- start:98 stop:1393 length:1296 start_codon:yes stop_codon:yes gene_type:complete
MAPYEAPSGKLAVLLDYVREDERNDVNHFKKRVSKGRGTDGKVFTKEGRDYCTNPDYDRPAKSHLMIDSNGDGLVAGLRNYFCLDARQAIDNTHDFPDKARDGTLKKSKVVCYGADRAFWDDDLNLVCEYNKDSITPDTVQTLYQGSKTSRVVKDVHDAVRESFCSNPNNLGERIDDQGGTCATFDKDQKVLEEFCSDGTNIKNHHLCQVTTSSNYDGKASPELYDKIAAQFCEQNPTDSWCSCYNVVEGVCDSDLSDAAGCEDHKNSSDGVKASVGDSAWANLKNKPQCNSAVCQTATSRNNFVYKASPHLMSCDYDLYVCSQIVDVEAAASSPITASCDIDVDVEETNETTTITDITTNEDTTTNYDTTDYASLADADDETDGDDDGEGDGEDDNSQNLYIGLGLLGAILLSFCCAVIILFIMKKKKRI